jgi:hypothetical protein
MSTQTPVFTTGFQLPVERQGPSDLAPELRVHGMVYKGQTTPYTEIEEFTGSNDELVIKFREVETNGVKTKREDMIFDVDAENAEVMLSIPQIISKHMRQMGVAQYDREKDPDCNTIINAPTYNFRRVRPKKGR